MNIEMIEYVYEGDDFEVSFKVFPHLNTEEQVRESIKRFFKQDITKDIEERFYGDSFLAITYTLAVKLYEMKVLATNLKSTSTLLEGIQNHIKKDLKVRGIFLAWLNLHDRDIFMKHDGLLYWGGYEDRNNGRCYEA